MIRKKAFTLTEIIIVVVISSVILAIMYKIISGTLQQMFKSSTKMTNLRAASIILEKIKNDVRCSTVPSKPSEKESIEEDNDSVIFSFYSTSEANKKNLDDPSNELKNKISYVYNKADGTLVRKVEDKNLRSSSHSINQAKVASFSIIEDVDKKYLTVNIIVDNEKNVENRSINSNNYVPLKAVLYPRFYTCSLTEDEIYWYESRTKQEDENL